MQVAEGQGDRAPASIGMQWGTTMNASTVLMLVEWHKLEQDAATALQLALGHYGNHVCVVCVCVVCGVCGVWCVWCVSGDSGECADL